MKDIDEVGRVSQLSTDGMFNAMLVTRDRWSCLGLSMSKKLSNEGTAKTILQKNLPCDKTPLK